MTMAVTGLITTNMMMPAVSAWAADSSALTSEAYNTSSFYDLSDMDTVNTSLRCSIAIHKIDITAAEAAKDYKEGTNKATGERDTDLEMLTEKYGIKGVEFTRLRFGQFEMYSKLEDGATEVSLVYEVPSAFAELIGLDASKEVNMGAGSGVAYPCSNTAVKHFFAQDIQTAFKAFLANDNVDAKNKLEDYIQSASGKAVFDLTDATGYTKADDLDQGLYLIVETKVPEEVTTTVDPFLVQVPFTSIDQGTEAGNTDAAGDGLHVDADADDHSEHGRRQWVYDTDVYPKDQSGNPTLDKEVKTATGKFATAVGANKTEDTSYLVYNAGDKIADPKSAGDDAYVNARDEYVWDETGTASEGEIIDYKVASRLPKITTKSTYLTEYSFVDRLSEGITYNKDMKIAFYTSKDAADANDLTKAVDIWATSGKDGDDVNMAQLYSTEYKAASGGSALAEVTYADVYNESSVKKSGESSATVRMTAAGLAKINPAYSEYYMVVYYSAKVNSDATTVLGDEGNPNDVTLLWRRTSNDYYNTLNDRCYVYTYGLDVSKYFSDNAGDPTKVTFNLFNQTDGSYIVAREADEGKTPSGHKTYYVTGFTKSKEDATNFSPDKDGKLVINGLEGDVYQLTETDTADGYHLLKKPVTIQIDPTDREVIPAVAGTVGLEYKKGAESSQAANIIDNYNGGIVNKFDTKVDEKTQTTIGDENASDSVNSKLNEAYMAIAEEAANGRTIGKADMYVGDVVCASATVDGEAGAMSAYIVKDETLRATDVDSENALVGIKVTNTKGFELPRTGGAGTAAMTMTGMCMLVLSFFGVKKSFKKREEHA